MGFLDDLLKDVEKGIDQVQKGADKLITETSLRSDIDKLKRGQRELLAEIGEEAVALYAAGEIALPGMSMQIAQLREIREKIEAKEDDLSRIGEIGTREIEADAAGSADLTKPTTDGQSSSPAFCTKCGARLAENATFCPGCGNKIA